MMNFREKYSELESEIERKKNQTREEGLEREKVKYTPTKRRLSLFIKDFIEVLHKKFHRKISTNNTYISISSDFKTKEFRYRFSEAWGKVTINVSTIEGIQKRIRRLKISFIPELEIKIKRKMGNSDAGVQLYLEAFEKKEKKEGWKSLPIMQIKTYTDLEYKEDRWHDLNDDKIEHYLNIINADLEAWIDRKFDQIWD